MNMQLPIEELIQPAEKCQDSIIYLLHPTLNTIIPLYRGTVADTLMRFGYAEVSKEVYEGAQDDRR